VEGGQARQRAGRGFPCLAEEGQALALPMRVSRGAGTTDAFHPPGGPSRGGSGRHSRCVPGRDVVEKARKPEGSSGSVAQQRILATFGLASGPGSSRIETQGFPANAGVNRFFADRTRRGEASDSLTVGTACGLRTRWQRHGDCECMDRHGVPDQPVHQSVYESMRVSRIATQGPPRYAGTFPVAQRWRGCMVKDCSRAG